MASLGISFSGNVLQITAARRNTRASGCITTLRVTPWRAALPPVRSRAARSRPRPLSFRPSRPCARLGPWGRAPSWPGDGRGGSSRTLGVHSNEPHGTVRGGPLRLLWPYRWSRASAPTCRACPTRARPSKGVAAPWLRARAPRESARPASRRGAASPKRRSGRRSQRRPPLTAAVGAPAAGAGRWLGRYPSPRERPLGAPLDSAFRRRAHRAKLRE